MEGPIHLKDEFSFWDKLFRPQDKFSGQIFSLRSQDEIIRPGMAFRGPQKFQFTSAFVSLRKRIKDTGIRGYILLFQFGLNCTSHQNIQVTCVRKRVSISQGVATKLNRNGFEYRCSPKHGEK